MREIWARCSHRGEHVRTLGERRRRQYAIGLKYDRFRDSVCQKVTLGNLGSFYELLSKLRCRRRAQARGSNALGLASLEGLGARAVYVNIVEFLRQRQRQFCASCSPSVSTLRIGFTSSSTFTNRPCCINDYCTLFAMLPPPRAHTKVFRSANNSG